MTITKERGKADDPSIDLHALGYRLLGRGPSKITPLTRYVRRNLEKTNIRVNHIVYVSSMFFWTLIASAASFPPSFLFINYFLPLIGLRIPAYNAVLYSLIITFASGGLTFITFLYYPKYIASSIKLKIEKNLVYIANYMSILASAGATPEETFASLARSGDIFGVRESARAIIRRVELLGEDVLKALDEESRRSPSREYADFLQGYVATLRIGGNLQTYLSAMANKFMESRRRLMAKMINQLNLAGEIFVAALVALPVILITVLSIMGFFGGEVLGGLTAPQLMALMTYVFIPFTAIGVLVFIDAVMAGW